MGFKEKGAGSSESCCLIEKVIIRIMFVAFILALLNLLFFPEPGFIKEPPMKVAEPKNYWIEAQEKYPNKSRYRYTKKAPEPDMEWFEMNLDDGD